MDTFGEKKRGLNSHSSVRVPLMWRFLGILFRWCILLSTASQTHCHPVKSVSVEIPKANHPWSLLPSTDQVLNLTRFNPVSIDRQGRLVTSEWGVEQHWALPCRR